MRWSVMLATALLAACSQGGITGKAAAQGILDARLESAGDDTCAAPGAIRSIGTFGLEGGGPAPVQDGTSNTGIVCTVHDLGDGRSNVHGEMYMNGERWFIVDGVLPARYDRAAFPDGITLGDVRMSVTSIDPSAGTTVVYGQNAGCVLKYANDGEGVAGGRAWGELTCPRALRGEIDAGDPAQACLLRARFRFENCAF